MAVKEKTISLNVLWYFILSFLHVFLCLYIVGPSKLQVTADEIATTIRIDPSQLDRQCSKDDLLSLSRLIPDWLDFSISLGLTEAERNGIRTDVQLINHSLKAYEMLDLWLKKGAYTPESHYRRLVEAALNQCTPDHKLAADICKINC